MIGSKVYTKQCMYSLKQSHGEVEKKNVVYVFSQKMRKRRKRERAKQFCVRGLLSGRMTHYFAMCDTGMFGFTVMLCDDEEDDRGESLDEFGELERTQTREVTTDGESLPQSDSPICRVVWYKNKNITENKSMI